MSLASHSLRGLCPKATSELSYSVKAQALSSFALTMVLPSCEKRHKLTGLTSVCRMPETL